MPDTQTISNWGNYPKVKTEVSQPEYGSQLKALLQSQSSSIARGNGRCYGDSALNAQHIISSQGLNKMLKFDTETGIFSCQAGVLLSDILKVIVPKGFFLPVTPGTKYISVGGAIAADVHGKNHHKDGCFSDHIINMQLMLPSGEVVQCSRNENKELFWLTCGGMGLTGIVLQASFLLKRIESAYISQQTYKAHNLEEIMAYYEQTKEGTYSVAWIDCLQKGKSLGRSILTVGEFSKLSELNGKKKEQPLLPHPEPKFNMPITLPGFVLNTLSIKAFNALYYGRVRKKESTDIVHYEPFFYPLDTITNWNRMYGPKGFTQYQFVLPEAASKEGLETILKRIAKSGQGSFLAVLKLFGKADPNAVLSFPIKGYTLALDFKVTKGLFPLLNELDAVVADHGGRIYLAKDARMNAETMMATYPRAEYFKREVAKLQNGTQLESLQSKRIGLTP